MAGIDKAAIAWSIAIVAVAVGIASTGPSFDTKFSDISTEQTTNISESKNQIHYGYSATADQYEENGFVISNVDITAPYWNPREKTPGQIEERAAFLTGKLEVVRTEEQQQRAIEAHEKYSDAIVINSLVASGVDLAKNTAEDYERALQRNLDAGITALSSTVYAYPKDGVLTIEERMDGNLEVMEKLGIELMTGTDSIRNAQEDNTMVVMFNSQGIDYLTNDLNFLENVKNQGMVVANFVYNNDNEFAGGSHEQKMGMTELGKDFVTLANDLGVIVDCSHSSTQTCIDASKQTQKPMIASHSNAYALHPVTRNISDEGLVTIGETGGVVCGVGAGLFLNEEFDASPEKFAVHIEYIGDLIGRDKTCFSTDFVHNFLPYAIEHIPRVDLFPPELGFGPPQSNLGPEHVWDVVSVLEDDYDWSEEEIRGFLGENLMRVYHANWN